jgi:hypothetical protein
MSLASAFETSTDICGLAPLEDNRTVVCLECDEGMNWKGLERKRSWCFQGIITLFPLTTEQTALLSTGGARPTAEIR